MRLLYRFVLFLLLILIGLVLTLIMAGILRRDSQHPHYKTLTAWWLRQICNILGIRIRTHGQQTSAPAMFVSNHISWLDIPVLASQINPRFLSKAEVGKWPLIGPLAKYSGTLFIQRGGTGSANNAIVQLADCLEKQQNVLVFPEGTTTDGQDLRRFHPRLLAAAVQTGAKVQPVALCYTDLQGEYDPDIPFIGKQTLFANALKIFNKKGAIADIHFLEPLTDTSKSRTEKAQQARDMIAPLIKYEQTPDQRP